MSVYSTFFLYTRETLFLSFFFTLFLLIRALSVCLSVCLLSVSRSLSISLSHNLSNCLYKVYSLSIHEKPHLFVVVFFTFFPLIRALSLSLFFSLSVSPSLYFYCSIALYFTFFFVTLSFSGLCPIQALSVFLTPSLSRSFFLSPSIYLSLSSSLTLSLRHTHTYFLLSLFYL